MRVPPILVTLLATLLCARLDTALAQPADPTPASAEQGDVSAAARSATAPRWHLPRKRARQLEHDALIPEVRDWSRLSDAARSAKDTLRKVGIVLDVDVALYDQYASETTTGSQNLGTFTWQAIGDWRLFRHDRLGTTYLHWDFLGSPGLNYDTGDRTLTSNIGAISGLNGNIYPDPAALDELVWKQVSPGRRLIFLAGRLDQSNYFDTNRVANDAYQQFFATALENKLSIPFPIYGGLGALVRVNLGKDIHVMVGAGDSSSDHPWGFWKSLDNDSWYELVEVGIAPSVPGLGEGHYRFTPWHNHLSGEDGFGIGVSIDQQLGYDPLVAFLRIGFGNDDVTAVEQFVSGGIALERPFGRRSDGVSLGIAWSDPGSGAGVRDETLIELFYRLALAPSIALTPDLQLVIDPANGVGEDVVAVGGVRLLLSF